MAERLTKKDYFAWHYRCGYQNKKDSLERTRKEHKLGKLEDILEKYGIERVEELECFLDDYSKNQGRDFAICEERDDLKKDRDTWKRACELACEREDDCYVYDNIHRAYEFYQQAKQVTGK